MNKRKKLALIQRILKQAVEMSTNNSIDVFVDWSSHVELLTVKVFENGWSEANPTEDYRAEVWFRIYDEATCLKRLQDILDYLEGVNKNEINRQVNCV